MHLNHLNLLNFKNIRQAELSFIEGINCFVGDNGAGKTNLLDAIYYLSFCKSYFNSIDSQLICHEEEFFVVQGRYERDSQPEDIYAGLKRSQKKQFKRNKKEYPRLSEHIGLLPLVMISPGDERLIVDGSDQRRKFVDGVISQIDKNYLEQLLRYNRILNQRNTLLKSARGKSGVIESQIDIWNSQLALTGQAIFDRRRMFVEQLEPVFQKYHNYISGGNEVVKINYHSHHQKGDIELMLQHNLAKDIVLGYTTRGVHRDDLELLLNSYAVKKDGSQGQKKTFFIALKLAQFEFLNSHFGYPPVLLLDDLFDKLDENRGNRLVELVGSDLFRQIFITDTQKQRLLDIVKHTGKNYAFFDVKEGEVVKDAQNVMND
ncbi:DNA replication/repair protein RecF [Alkaliflexus imshenetskii]|uniref:DNA replication/repair protein RecF n=1 Tax=Alkaliflexus imshenetskii TaxID=286730 RepID=UPI0005C49744|nr:DNA replication and repair protein RecF [Alkaliflexus imshenetskii]